MQSCSPGAIGRAATFGGLETDEDRIVEVQPRLSSGVKVRATAYIAWVTPLIVPGSKSNGLDSLRSQASAQLRWRMTRNLTWFTEYGHFFAGDFLKPVHPCKSINYWTGWLDHQVLEDGIDFGRGMKWEFSKHKQ